MQRGTAAAVVVSLALHALVLLGVARFSAHLQHTPLRLGHSDLPPDQQRLPPLMQGVLVPHSMLALQAKATPVPAHAVTTPAAHSSPVSPAQQMAVKSPPQPSPPTAGGAQPAQTRPTDAVAGGFGEGEGEADGYGDGDVQAVRSRGKPSAPATPAADLQATAAHHSQGERPAAAAGASPAEAPAWQQAPQVARPDYAYNPPPQYPLLLREQGVGGVVWLRVWVERDGRPADIRIAQGSGYRLLDDAALRAVKQWRFTPASHAGQRLAGWVEFPVRFKLDSDSLV
ncbi:MAG: energy transducer TonB [Rhodoferax sp.]|nr:energy transducer TonB [Rhodoferax sp.]